MSSIPDTVCYITDISFKLDCVANTWFVLYVKNWVNVNDYPFHKTDVYSHELQKWSGDNEKSVTHQAQKVSSSFYCITYSTAALTAASLTRKLWRRTCDRFANRETSSCWHCGNREHEHRKKRGESETIVHGKHQSCWEMFFKLSLNGIMCKEQNPFFYTSGQLTSGTGFFLEKLIIGITDRFKK